GGRGGGWFDGVGGNCGTNRGVHDKVKKGTKKTTGVLNAVFKLGPGLLRVLCVFVVHFPRYRWSIRRTSSSGGCWRRPAPVGSSHPPRKPPPTRPRPSPPRSGPPPPRTPSPPRPPPPRPPP